jgi:hypothetical protein
MPNPSQKLWIVGCSIAHGVGVAPAQRWGNLVGQSLNLNPIFLTAEGSSIEWGADQILQADINPGDIVLWGLTSVHRYLYYNDSGNPQHILRIYYNNYPNFEKIISVNRLIDLNLAYKSANHISQVINFLNKLQCKYVINCMLSGIAEHQSVITSKFANNPNFIAKFDRPDAVPTTENIFSRNLSDIDLYVDRGTDGIHPGPIQHRLYADQFLNTLNSND